MWLFNQFDRVDRAKWVDTTQLITATEYGTLRALARGFNQNSEPPPDLPTYDELLAERKSQHDDKPAWMREFERVNKSRTDQE